jgi:ABC-2 type transport system ATP-binding protein
MRDMRTMVRRLASEGMTVLLSSHLLAEVEELCNRVAIVRSGRIVYEGALDELKRSAGGGYGLRTTDVPRAEAICRTQPGIHDVRETTAGQLVLTADEDAIAQLSVALGQAGVGILALVPETVSLESLFFRLTEGRDGEQAEAPVEPAEAVA